MKLKIENKGQNLGYGRGSEYSYWMLLQWSLPLLHKCSGWAKFLPNTKDLSDVAWDLEI